MSDLNIVSKTLTLKFANQQYTNSYIDIERSKTDIYELGMSINALQAETPEKVILTEKSEFINA